MNMMKRLCAFMLTLCLFLPIAVLAEEETYIPGADEDVVFPLDDIDAQIDDTVDLTRLNLNENLPDHVINILLVGVDGNIDDLSARNLHGDTQIIVSINREDGSIVLTSVMRDLYVYIPGRNEMNRINRAYYRGGGKMAMRTVNNLLEMNIQHYVAINFNGLAAIIESLGGVDIEISKVEAKAVNAAAPMPQPLEAADGVQHLNGAQAVAYARLRATDNDFKRTERQRRLLETLLNQVLADGMNMDKLLSLLEACLPHVLTNMKTNEIFLLAMDVLRSGILTRLENGEALLQQNRIPMDNTWKYYTTEEGASVIAFRSNKRLRENIEALHTLIYGEYIPAK